MKVLWICNIILPKISREIGVPETPLGGWLTGLSNDLLKEQSIELTVCFPHKQEIEGHTQDGMSYYSFTQKNTTERISQILKTSSPEIIHIFGTELPHSFQATLACQNLGILNRLVISIQGLVSVLEKHYFEGLETSAFFSPTLRSIFFNDSVIGARKKLRTKGALEISTLQKCLHIIGRTDWDYAWTRKINPNATYHHCDESLRDAFYDGCNWELEKCEKHSIFFSQCSYPIKGFHLMLEAMPEILKDYPDAHIYITGRDILKPKSLKDWIKTTSYQKYLSKIIQKKSLENKITFLGRLNEFEIINQLLKSHVFVSASTCENSPNSLGEAMMLGVPSVASDVGGIKNMLDHGIDGYIYQPTEPIMLAHYVKSIFKNDTIANFFSQNAKKHATHTHNRKKNLSALIKVYQSIANP